MLRKYADFERMIAGLLIHFYSRVDGYGRVDGDAQIARGFVEG